MKTSEEIEEVCKKLRPVLGEKAGSLWHMYLAEGFKGRQELKENIEIIAEKYLSQKPLDTDQILLPPPSKNSSKGRFLVGNVQYNRKSLHPLYLRPEDFIKQVGIFAITGEGKTNLAYLLALQLMKNGTPMMVIDWKRSWRNLLSLNLPELKGVKVFTIGRDALPFLWNPLRPPPGADRELWISTVAEALEKSHLSGPGVAYHFQKIYSKLIRSLPDDFCPNFYDGLKEMQQVKVFGRELMWKQTALRIFQTFTTGSAAKAFNARNPIKLEELLDKPVIFELDMELPKALRVFFSEMMLRWIHLYRLGQGETDKLRHVLFLEEVHNLFAESGMYQTAGSLENVYREIRGFGQGLVSITQHPSRLPVFLLGNCHTQIYLGLQHAEDIRAARQALFLKYDEEVYPSLLNIGECIVKVKNRIEPCLVKTPLVSVTKGLGDARLKIHDLGSIFWEHAWKDERKYLESRKVIGEILSGENRKNKSRNTSPEENTPARNTSLGENTPFEKRENMGGYSPMSTPVNNRVEGSSGQNQGHKAPRKPDANINGKKREYPPEDRQCHQLLVDVFQHPFSSTTERYKRLKFYYKLGDKCRRRLIFDKCIHPRKVVTKEGCITLFDLTQKGKLALRDLGYEVDNRSEGIVHKFWKNKIAEDYKAKGYDVEIETYYINGRPDIIARKDGKSIAVEIETGKSDFMHNIQRAIDAGFDEVVCVATNERAEKKIREGVGRRSDIKAKVRVIHLPT